VSIGVPFANVFFGYLNIPQFRPLFTGNPRNPVVWLVTIMALESDNLSASDNQQATVSALMKYHPFIDEISDVSESRIANDAFQMVERFVLYQICGLDKDQASDLDQLENLIIRKVELSNPEMKRLRVLRTQLRSGMVKIVQMIESSENTNYDS
jgi:hypothetical protein